jgi:hypothetical protein
MQSATDDAPRIAAMRKLWVRMAAVYGYRWTSAYGERCDDDSGALTVAGDTWQRGLSGVGEHRIGTGLNACLMSADPWPPTLPHFRALCMEIPMLAIVAKAIREGSDFSPFVTLVWRQLDAPRFRQSSIEKAEALLRDAYAIAREHVMGGKSLPKPPEALITHQRGEPAERAPCDPAVAKQAIADIARTLNISDQA